MKALIVGGTGVISQSVVKRLCDTGWEVTLINRGSRELPDQRAKQLIADINDEETVKKLLENAAYDAVCDFIVYTPGQAARDVRLFAGKTQQYVFVSSASAYEKPVMHLPITEDTPLKNPYWRYSQEKAACEEYFMQEYRATGFPVTVVRPSHTYSERSMVTQIHGRMGAWAVMQRIMEGKSIPVSGDGETLWTVTTAEDFAVYFCALLGKKETIGEAYHITSDESLTWNGIYRTLAALLHGEYRPCYAPADVLAQLPTYDLHGSLLGDKGVSVAFDNSKVQRATGVGRIAFTSFAEGAARSVQYFLAHPELQKEDPEYDAFCDMVEEKMRELKKLL